MCFRFVVGLLALSALTCVALDPEAEAELEKQKDIIGALTRQIMMQQLTSEEISRASGDSGIKLTRGWSTGTRPWFAANHANRDSFNAIHDHANTKRTVGMGEVVVVLNGVEFRTRHNDFSIRMPSNTSNVYHEVEDIEFPPPPPPPPPPVPPSVLEKPTPEEQIKEMREYFIQFKKNNPNKLDYRPYFKPVVCYLEGAWTQSQSVEEDWNLIEKIRYTSYTGRKDNSENYSFLPMKIINLINNNTEPDFAQWDYRILCAPLGDKTSLPRDSALLKTFPTELLRANHWN